MRLDAATVRNMTRATAVLDRFAEEYRDRPEIRLARCPACGHQSRRGRESFVIDRESGEWIHHSGARADGTACRGDVLDLVAAYAGIDIRRDFPRVLEIAASIAGITTDTDPAELERICAARQAERAARERRAAEERARGEAMIPALWDTLGQRHRRGEAYLTSRGLDPAELRQLGDIVRYYHDGSPAVRLHSFETGAPINIVRRRLAGDPKILALDLAELLGTEDIVGTCSTIGTLVGRVQDLDIAGEGPDVAILPEGVADSLAALLAFPGCVVVGANGWHMMPRVAAAIAPRVAQAHGWLLVGAHADQQGIRGAGEAMHVAEDAGLTLRSTVRGIDIGEHKDLADAWRAGWRWTWPNPACRHGGAA